MASSPRILLVSVGSSETIVGYSGNTSAPVHYDRRAQLTTIWEGIAVEGH